MSTLLNINTPIPEFPQQEIQDNNYPSSPPLFPDSPPPSNLFDAEFDRYLPTCPTPQISQPRTVRLRRQPVKEYRIYILPSKVYPP